MRCIEKLTCCQNPINIRRFNPPGVAESTTMVKFRRRAKTAFRGSAILCKRFLNNPGRVAYIVPSGPILINRVLKHMDLSVPRIIAEFGPGEGCVTRKILEKAHKDSRIFLFELDPVFVKHLRDQFADDPRVVILHSDCRELKNAMTQYEIEHFDYVFSGIPFSLMEKETKKAFMKDIYDSLKPNSNFIIYQVTNELVKYADHFDGKKSEYCLLNMPPMVVTAYHKNGVNPTSSKVAL